MTTPGDTLTILGEPLTLWLTPQTPSEPVSDHFALRVADARGFTVELWENRTGQFQSSAFWVRMTSCCRAKPSFPYGDRGKCPACAAPLDPTWAVFHVFCEAKWLKNSVFLPATEEAFRHWYEEDQNPLSAEVYSDAFHAACQELSKNFLRYTTGLRARA